MNSARMNSVHMNSTGGRGSGMIATGDDRNTVVDIIVDFIASASGNVANPTRLQSITLPAGLGIGGRFSSVAVTSGVVIAYFE
jgi:hypothetical protein